MILHTYPRFLPPKKDRRRLPADRPGRPGPRLRRNGLRGAQGRVREGLEGQGGGGREGRVHVHR